MVKLAEHLIYSKIHGDGERERGRCGIYMLARDGAYAAHIREMSKSKNEEENNKKKIHKNKENVNAARIVLWFRLLIVGDINACSVRAFLFITFSSLHAATRGTAVRTEVMTRVHT